MTPRTEPRRASAPARPGSGSAGPAPPLLEVAGVSKHFGGIVALEEVSLTVRRGEVHALCGANGAGKSTLVRILAGAIQPNSGTIRLGGEPLELHSPGDAESHGMRFIHQELNLVPKFSAVANMALGDGTLVRHGVLDRRRAGRRATAVMERLGATFDLGVGVEKLTVSERWMVSLGRALMSEARMIAMDEPTASFTAEEAERLFAVIDELRCDGVAILYISHRLEEVLRLSQRVTVLRNGRLVATHDTASLTTEKLTHEIVGREVAASGDQVAASPTTGEVVLRVRGLARPPRVRGLSLELRRGEILGIAGLVGSGRTELLRLIFGADRAAAGELEVAGKRYAPRGPHDAIKRGIALVPEERRSEGLLLLDSIAFNLALADPGRSRRGGTPLLSPAKERSWAERIIARLGIVASSPNQLVAELSGGNQQKVVLGKFIGSVPVVLMLDEPTVGVDVGARAEIYRVIAELAGAGTAVLLVSSEFEELEICDRVGVMREGRLTHVLNRAESDKDRLTALCYATEEEAA